MLNMGLPNQPVDPAANFPSRAIVSKTMLHLPDWSALELPPHAQFIHDSLGVRAALYLPLLRGDECIGLLVYGVNRPRVFSAQEIAVAESFRDQALIAIENTRLFNETKEALEQQTASAEVLQVIGNSMADARPVFDRILMSAEGLFDADVVGVFLIEHAGEEPSVRLAANRGMFKEAIEAAFPIPLQGSATQQAVESGHVVAFPDVLNGEGVPPGLRRLVQRLGVNYSLAQAPMMWEGRGLGAINVARFDMRPFTEKECGLLELFANQAVIAIQNARLFNETKEALERQTATAEVLQVIGRSMADAQPVFDAIIDSCTRLFRAEGGGVALLDEAGLLHLRSARVGRETRQRIGNAAADAVIEKLIHSFPRPLAGTLTERARSTTCPTRRGRRSPGCRQGRP
jgi:GAF domain-containing protein